MPVLEAQKSKAPPARGLAATTYLAGLATRSQRTMAEALDTCASLLAAGGQMESFAWHTVSYEQLVRLRASLAARYSPATANKLLCAVRGTLKAAVSLGLTDPVSYVRAASVRSVRGNRVAKGRCLSKLELQAMLDACGQDTLGGARDRALILVMFGCGLRRSEVVSLDLRHFNSSEGVLLVLGKGNVERIAFLPPEAVDALSTWTQHRGPQPGPLFLPVTRGGRALDRRLTDQAVYDALGRISERAGVERMSPHDLRRTFITTLLDRGVDVSTVQRMAAHASVTTTVRYDRRGLEAQRRAARQLSVLGSASGESMTDARART